MECGVWSCELCMWDAACGVRSVEGGGWSVELGEMRSAGVFG